MKRALIFAICMCQIALAGSGMPESRRTKKTVVVLKKSELPDSIGTRLKLNEPVDVKKLLKEDEKDQKNIIFTLLRLVLTVLLIVLVVLLILILV